MLVPGNYYRIVCTMQEPSWASNYCARIVSVGASEGDTIASYDLTLDQVVAYLAKGVKFYTKGLTSGKIAFVESYYCSSCRRYHIRTYGDCTKDNNLDELRTCAWKSAA